MGMMTYEGTPPFGLVGVQRGSADAVGDTVEMVLHVSDPALSPLLERIHIPLTAMVAGHLGNALLSASITAQQNSRKT
jgi:hypothetical protein